MKHVTKKMLNLATAVAMAMAIGAPTQVFAAELVATKSKELAGRTYTFQKWMDAKGNATAVILDEKGNTVSARDLPPITRNIMQPQLAQLLRTQDSRGRVIKVNVALNIPFTAPTETAQAGTVEISEKGKTQQLWINGRRISEQRYARVQAAEQQARRAQAIERFAERNAFVQAFAKRHNLELAKGALEASGSTLTFELKAEQIKALVNSGDSSVLGIELYREPQIDSAGAENMAASGIDPWALNNTLARGSGIGVYWTEIGCPDEDDIDAPYTRLSGTPHWHSQIVGDVLRDVSPDSTMYCRADWTLPTQNDLTELNPSVDVVNQSGSIDEQTSYDTCDQERDDFVYVHSIPWFNSAGNEGDTATGDDGLVGGCGQGLNVITLGNYIHEDQTIEIESSWIDPSTGNDKPEVVAPATSTSRASPHAAGFSVDSMSQSTWQKNKPHLVKAKQIAGATDEIAGGYDKVGVGGIDFLSSHYDGWNFWWHGNNGDFSSWDAADGVADNYITQQVFIPNTYDGVRIAMTWLTRGTYTFDHKDDAHAIGMDLDLTVYDPSGSYVGSSSSWDNAWEVVDFTPTTAGYYTFKIKRFSNNDTVNNMRVGVAVNFYND
jgi:hypothetical protein